MARQNPKSNSYSKDTLMAWGVVSILAGILMLINLYDFIPQHIAKYIFDWKSYLIYIGIIFLIFHHQKYVGSILTITGITLLAQNIYLPSLPMVDYCYPLFFTILGALVVFFSHK